METNFIKRLEKISTENGFYVEKHEIVNDNFVIMYLGKDDIVLRCGFYVQNRMDYIRTFASTHKSLDFPLVAYFRKLKRNHRLCQIFIASFYSSGTETWRADDIDAQNCLYVAHDHAGEPHYVVAAEGREKFFPTRKKKKGGKNVPDQK